MTEGTFLDAHSGRNDDLWGFDERIRREGYRRIAGVDEAGRGCLAGPVVAAAVVLPHEFKDARIRDSKQLSASSREFLFDVITRGAVSYGVGLVAPETIDSINILRAALLAMEMAVQELNEPPDIVLVDGNQRMPGAVQQLTVKGGDNKSLSIASASIIAKVYRDRLMREFETEYPEYGFASNKGYGTRSHVAALNRFGPCPIHRKSFAPVRRAAESLPELPFRM